MTNKGATGMVPVKNAAGLADPLFRTFHDRFNRLFGEHFGNWMEPLMEENWSIKAWTPKCDIYETDHEIVVKVELPDVKREDIKVSIENNMLTIRGERKFEEETKRENYHRVERSYGEFRRTFTLPDFADPGKVDADYRDGMLRVTLAKKDEVKPKQVEIKVS
ncbi:MAG: Hsp20/alpha crystallin family protein [Blastocatellia bacterium]